MPTATMTDFSTPRRMSPGALIIIFLKSAREMAGVFMIGIPVILFDSHDNPVRVITRLLTVFAVVFAITLLVAFLKYYFCKFHIHGDKLIFTHGFLARQTTSIPLTRVHTLRTRSGLFYRLVEMRGVSFDTLASDKQEVELILDESEWRSLLESVRMGEGFGHGAQPDVTLPPPLVQATRRVSDANILKGALCQNHLKGFAILAAAFVMILNQVGQIKDGTERLADYIEGNMDRLAPTVWDGVLFGLILYLVVMVLWIGRIALRYAGMTLRFSDNRLTLESGLLTRYTSRIDRAKATVLMLKRNPLERIAHCETITLLQAYNATDSKPEGKNRIYGSDLGAEVSRWWLGANGDDGDSVMLSARSGRGLFMLKFVPALPIAAGLFLLLYFCAGLTMLSVILSLGYVAVWGVRAFMAWKHSGIELTEKYVRINCGNIARIRKYIKYGSIESVTVGFTPFTSLTGRVSLRISTNADVSAVRSLRIDSAMALRHLLLSRSE